MDDLISRQQAIDAMEKLYQEDVEMYGCSIPECFDAERANEALKQLQPAPDYKKQYEDLSRIVYGIPTRHYEELYDLPLTKVEEALGFKLFTWQKTRICLGTSRQSGRTTATTIMRLLKGDHDGKVYLPLRPRRQYDLWEKRFVLDMATKLQAAGIEIKEIKFS